VNAEGFAIVHACSAADMEHVRALFAEYQQWLNVDLCFQGFDDELRTLPGAYAPPRGRLLLARDGEAVAGTVGMWPLGAEVVEMKRLFVRPPWRGRGLGRRLAKAIVDEAKAAGYARMRLDSLERLVAARALYESMGFVRIPAYYDNPLDGVLFMQLDLTMASHGA
jgi:GNAT superfamily N-acetyltransferase